MENFEQLCVWPGQLLGEETPQALEDFFKEQLNVRIQYKESVTTLPDRDSDDVEVP